MSPETEDLTNKTPPDRQTSWNAETIVSSQEGKKEPRYAAELANGRYKVLHTLGSGGQAHAVLALDTKTGEKVTVKLARPNSCYLQDGYFAREIKLLGRLGKLTNLVPLLYDFETTKENYLVTKFVDGESLLRIVTTGRTEQLTLEQKIAMIADVCEPLGIAHENGIVHRDIKPDNILLSTDNNLVLIDWGLAKDDQQTDTQQPVGTLLYCPPEQLSDKTTPSADVYSLGAVLHELITGNAFRTFPDFLTFAQKATLVARGGGRINYRAPNVPSQLLEILEKAHAQNPNDRYCDAKEFKTALESYLIRSSSRQLSDTAWTAGKHCIPV